MTSIKGDDGAPTGFVPSAPYGVWGDAGSPASMGVIGASKVSYGVAGYSLDDDLFQPRAAGVYGTGMVGVAGYTTGSMAKPPVSLIAVFGSSVGGTEATGVHGGTGVMGVGDIAGVVGNSGRGDGVTGSSTSGAGVGGASMSGPGVVGASNTNIGVSGSSGYLGDGRLAIGVQGQCKDGVGVSGVGTGSATGVMGRSDAGIGIYGMGSLVGLFAQLTGGTSAAWLALPGLAGGFWGDVVVSGKLVKAGGGFLIDHPLEPANKTLAHSFVESPERKNLYDGIAILDDVGEAEVSLPSWFCALNEGFRYQVTCLGKHAPVYIADEIQDNRFRIAGGSPGLKVSWHVTGVRKDAWAKANPLVADELKSPEERGLFLHPTLHGASAERDLLRARFPRPPEASTVRVEEPTPRRVP